MADSVTDGARVSVAVANLLGARARFALRAGEGCRAACSNRHRCQCPWNGRRDSRLLADIVAIQLASGVGLLRFLASALAPIFLFAGLVVCGLRRGCAALPSPIALGLRCVRPDLVPCFPGVGRRALTEVKPTGGAEAVLILGGFGLWAALFATLPIAWLRQKSKRTPITA